MYLANTHMKLKDYAKAESVLTSALLKFGANDVLHFNLAVVFEKTGRFDAMVDELKRAIEINPKNADALNYLGYSYADKSIMLSEAHELVTRALEIKPDDGYIIDSLGWVYYRQGKYDLALKNLRKAAELLKTTLWFWSILAMYTRNSVNLKGPLSTGRSLAVFGERRRLERKG